MRSIFIIPMILFLLTACGAAAQPAAPTAVPTATILPTSTLAPIKTPTAAVTSTPVESQLPETPALTEISDAYKAENAGYELGWSKTDKTKIALFFVDPETKEKAEVPEIAINPEDGSGLRNYDYITPEGKVIPMTVNYTKEELIARNFEGWIIKDGELVRETHQFPGLVDGKEVKDGPILEVISNAEVNAEIALTAGVATEKEREATSKTGYEILNKLFGRNFFGTKKAYYTYGGMLISSSSGEAFGDNQLEIRNEQTGEIKIVDTSFYVVTEAGQDKKYGLVGWRADKIDFTRIVDKPNLKTAKNFNSIFTKRPPKI